MMKWDIRSEGRAWGSEAMSRYEMTPEKTEMVAGKLYWSDEDRVAMLGLLLENVGADRAVRLGDPDVWRAAVAGLDERARTSDRGEAEFAPPNPLPSTRC